MVHKNQAFCGFQSIITIKMTKIKLNNINYYNKWIYTHFQITKQFVAHNFYMCRFCCVLCVHFPHRLFWFNANICSFIVLAISYLTPFSYRNCGTCGWCIGFVWFLHWSLIFWSKFICLLKQKVFSWNIFSYFFCTIPNYFYCEILEKAPFWNLISAYILVPFAQ